MSEYSLVIPYGGRYIHVYFCAKKLKDVLSLFFYWGVWHFCNTNSCVLK